MMIEGPLKQNTKLGEVRSLYKLQVNNRAKYTVYVQSL